MRGVRRGQECKNSLSLRRPDGTARHLGLDRVKIERQLSLERREKREKFLVVFVRVKDILPVIPSGDDVIKAAFEFNSSLSCHDPAVL